MNDYIVRATAGNGSIRAFAATTRMSTLSSANYDYSKWEKVGDVYKQFSIYDTSKYESISSSNIILNK